MRMASSYVGGPPSEKAVGLCGTQASLVVGPPCAGDEYGGKFGCPAGGGARSSNWLYGGNRGSLSINNGTWITTGGKWGSLTVADSVDEKGNKQYEKILNGCEFLVQFHDKERIGNVCDMALRVCFWVLKNKLTSLSRAYRHMYTKAVCTCTLYYTWNNDIVWFLLN